MKHRPWTGKRIVIALVALAVSAVPMQSGADITGGLASGYSDTFNYEDASITNNVPLDPAAWQTYPVASNGASVPNIWMVGGVQTSTLGEPGSEIKALKQQSTGAGPSEPVAYVRGGDWRNMIVSTRASFVGNSINSGIGIVFRAPVDPVSGLADRNNYYLFTAVQKTPDARDCFTGRCYFLIKRVGGAFFLAGMAHTYLNFVNPTGPGESHVYKVVMSGNRILAYVDNYLVMEVTDTPGDDQRGMFSMPGPMFANGTVGLRSSNTKAWFDDFTVLGDGPRAYETRAAAMSIYGQIGVGTNGSVQQVIGADTNPQYNDHDFMSDVASGGLPVSQVSPSEGIAGGSMVTTKGQDGTASATAQLLGFTGAMTQRMPDGSTIDITFSSDAITASARASCESTFSEVRIANFTYLIVVKNPNGEPIINDGKVTNFIAPPNTVIEYPSGSGGYVKITLNSQKKTIDPRRLDVSAVRIDLLQSKASVGTGTSTIADTGITTASIKLANVVAGRLCEPII